MYIDDEIKFNYNSRRFFNDNKEVYRLITTSEKINKLLEDAELENSEDGVKVIEQTKYENTNIIEMGFSLTEEETKQNQYEDREKEMCEEEEKDIILQKYLVISDYFNTKYKVEEEIYGYSDFLICINLFVEKNKEFLIKNNLLKTGFCKTKISKNLVLFLISEFRKMSLPDLYFLKLNRFRPEEMKRDSFHEYNFLDISHKL